MSDTIPTADVGLVGNRRNARRERRVTWILRAGAIISILISVGIIASLVGEALVFLAGLDSISQLWAPEGWRVGDGYFDLRTLLIASVWISAIGMLVAVPLGLGAAVWLSEYANRRVRRYVKPIMEVLAGVPSVVIGFFALTFITPNLVLPVFSGASFFNMVSAGIAVGVLSSPYMASISEDALRSVPGSLREASYGLGARKRATVTKVVVPAAISGLVAAFILTLSRAIGETMIVTIAAGSGGSAPFNANPLEEGLTLTAAIANLALGSDAVTTGTEYKSLYFVGLVLFALTLGLNLLGDKIVRRYRKVY